MSQNHSDPLKRIHSLDAIRGIAALFVVFSHCYLLLMRDGHPYGFLGLMNTPLRIIINGYGAVSVFFVLSGFVLSLPFFKGSFPSYRTFALRRLCRIYIPFLCSILMAAALYAAVDRQPTTGMPLLDALWPSAPLTVSMLIKHLTMIGTYGGIILDRPTWSLVHEMRISLIFPFLVLLSRHEKLGMAVIIGSYVGAHFYLGHFGHFVAIPEGPADLSTSFMMTLSYVPQFMFGIFLAKYDASIRRAGTKTYGWIMAVLWIVGFFILSLNGQNQLFDISGAVLIIALARSSGTAEKILDTRILQWLGKISYSLYLVHVPIIFSMAYVLLPRMPLPAILVLGVGISLGGATLMHKFVEIPSIRIGKFLTQDR